MRSSCNGGLRLSGGCMGICGPSLLLGLLLVTLPFITTTHALTYHFFDSTPVCFMETIDDVRSSQITGMYNWIASTAFPPSQVQLRLSVKDGSGNVYYDKEMMEGEHSFSVMPNSNVLSGEQFICFTPSRSFAATEDTAVKVRIELDHELKKDFNAEKIVEKIEMRRQVDGLDVYTYQEAGGQLKDTLQPRAYLETIERALGGMERLLVQVVDSVSVSLDKEGRMRKTSESTFTRVWVCAVLLISVITSVLWLQFYFLKSTLRKKKLL